MKVVYWLGFLGACLWPGEAPDLLPTPTILDSRWLSHQEMALPAEQDEVEKEVSAFELWLGRGSNLIPFRQEREARLSLVHPIDSSIPFPTAFAEPLSRSLAIRKSDLPAAEKGRAIAKLVEPWMTTEHIHALFGESKAVVNGPTPAPLFGRTLYADYGVVIEIGKSCQLEVKCLPRMPENGFSLWESRDLLDQIERRERSRLFEVSSALIF